MRETHLRILAKGASWRVWGTIISIMISYFITHKFNVALEIGCAEFFTKIGLYYLHERFWHFVPWGIKH